MRRDRRRNRPPLRKSLFGRLLAVSALVAACSVAATAWLAVQTTSGAIKQEQGQNLTADARIYNTLLGYAAGHPTWEGVDDTVRDLARQSGRRIALTTEQRRPLADSASRPAPPALPPQASAIVDPLSVDTALSRTVDRSGDAADRVDPRAVGPFRLPAAERKALQHAADRSAACLSRVGIAADVVTGPSGRPRMEIVGNDPDRVQNTRCTTDVLDSPTATEQKALDALNQLADACLKRQDRPGVQLNLDLSWGDGSVPKPAVKTRAATPTPAPPPNLRTDKDDRATASCVDTARREQLSSYVASPALLFIGDEDGTTVPGFDLSPRTPRRSRARRPSSSRSPSGPRCSPDPGWHDHCTRSRARRSGCGTARTPSPCWSPTTTRSAGSPRPSTTWPTTARVWRRSARTWSATSPMSCARR